MVKWLLVIFSLLVGSCTFTQTRMPEPTQLTPPSRPTALHLPSQIPINPAWVAARACESLINHPSNPFAGRLVRFKTPIQVNTAGIPAATLALRKIDEKTDHAVTFIEVNQDPDIGIIFILGDAVSRDGAPGCGNVTSQPDPRSGVRLPASGSGELTGRMYVHLGGINSSGCKYSPDREPYPIAEHEMGHALGLGLHFTNFNGDEGFSDELAAVIKLIYSLPIGTSAVTVCK